MLSGLQPAKQRKPSSHFNHCFCSFPSTMSLQALQNAALRMSRKLFHKNMMHNTQTRMLQSVTIVSTWKLKQQYQRCDIFKPCNCVKVACSRQEMAPQTRSTGSMACHTLWRPQKLVHDPKCGRVEKKPVSGTEIESGSVGASREFVDLGSATGESREGEHGKRWGPQAIGMLAHLADTCPGGLQRLLGT